MNSNYIFLLYYYTHIFHKLVFGGGNAAGLGLGSVSPGGGQVIGQGTGIANPGPGNYMRIVRCNVTCFSQLSL